MTVAKQESALMVKEVSYLSNGEEVRLTGGMVKQYLTRGNKEVNDAEVVLFMNLCRYQQLNPFLNEAYLVKFDNNAQLIVGKDAFMKRAETHVGYEGFKAGIIIQRGDHIIEQEGSFMLPKDILLGGWAEVHRNDRIHPTVAKVSMAEYNKSQSTWKQIPSTMIRKVALVQALREAFPSNLGGLYTEEEIIQPVTVTQEEKVAETIKQNANSQVVDFKETAKEVVYQDVSAKNDNPKDADQEQVKLDPGF